MTDEINPLQPSEEPTAPLEPVTPPPVSAPTWHPAEPAYAGPPAEPSPGAAYGAPTAEPAPTYAPAPVYAAPPAPAAGPPAHSGGGSTIVLAVVAALVMGAIAGVAGGYLGGRLSSGGGTTSSGMQKITVVPSTTDEPVVAAAAAAVPSIVNIDVSEASVKGGQNGLPNSHPTVPITGNGSGVAFMKVPSGGTYILTNNHVVAKANIITVSDTSGRSYTGTLVGRDPDSDIAVVRISENLPVIELGDSTKLLVGQTVVAIGSPFGFEHSVTSGVVSALGRSLSNVGDGTSSGYPLVDVIQTAAAINPGNSGGALVDRSGRLVGINTAIYTGASVTDQASNAGIGFAIPVKTAARVADDLISGGKVGHPFIGLIGGTVDSIVATQKKLSVQQGAYVQALTPSAGAQKAGIQVGDVVTAVDGADIRTMDDLIIAVRRHAIGDTVKITLRRGTQTLMLNVTVGDKPTNLAAPSQESSTTTPGK